MVRPIEEFPVELLLYLTEHLRYRDSVLNFRLVCRSFATAGASCLQKFITRLCFTSSPRSVRNFQEICNHPFFRSNIKEVIYIGDINHGLQHASMYGVDANILWLSESGVMDGMPELQDFHEHRNLAGLQAMAAIREQEYEVLRKGLLTLPRLVRLTYSRIWPRVIAFNKTHKSGSRLHSNTEIENLICNPTVMTRDEYYDIVLEDNTHPYWNSHDDWIGVRHVLDAFHDQRRSGKNLVLGLKSWILDGLRADEAPIFLACDRKWATLTRAMFTLTALDLSLHNTYGHGDVSITRKFADALNSATNLKGFAFAWDFHESLNDSLAKEIVTHCTWKRLWSLRFERVVPLTWVKDLSDYHDDDIGFSPADVRRFFERHSASLQSVYLRNISLRDRDIAPTSSDEHSGSFMLAPLREVFASMRLKGCRVILDTFHDIPEEYEDLRLLNDQIKKLAVKVGVRNRFLETVSSNIRATYDFGHWLKGEKEHKASRS